MLILMIADINGTCKDNGILESADSKNNAFNSSQIEPDTETNSYSCRVVMSSLSSTTTTITVLPMVSASKVTMQNRTYWESLSEQDRRDSVNEHKSRLLGKKIGWGCAGPIREKWNNEIYPLISVIINNRKNYEMIFSKTNTQLTIPCSLYMVGDPWERAEPTIVAISSSRGIASKICDLLKSSTSLKNLNLGFNFMFFKDEADIPYSLEVDTAGQF
jgi:hypothetical protein